MSSNVAARLYAGQWIADCPRRGCNSAEALVSVKGERAKHFQCSECGQRADIEWADEEKAIEALMRLRPIPHTRNWFPKDHKLAIKANLPHGQTIEELILENFEHGAF